MVATQKPRIVAVWMVVVALVLGVLPAVGVAPVAIGLWRVRIAAGTPEFAAYAFKDGHALVAMRYDMPLGTVWNTGSDPDTDRSPFLTVVRQRGATEHADDPRPRFARTELDGERRGATWMRVGWPFESTHAIGRTAPSGSGWRRVGMWEPTIRGRQWSVPYLPLWPGLLANTVLYALLVLSPFVLWRWQRRRRFMRRVERGRCVACGYELGDGVAVCPECGLAREA